MEKGQNSQSTHEITKNDQFFYKSSLPYFILIIGIFITLAVWHSMGSTPSFGQNFATPLQISMPWMVLGIGFFVSLLAAIALHLAQLSHRHSVNLIKMNKDFQNEIAAHLKAEEIKKNLEIALLQGQKLQAIGTLAGGIAHDFNNILYAIKGYVEMSRDDVPKDTLVYDNLGKVLEATQRGVELVSRILAFSRRQQPHEFKSMSIVATVESVLALVRPTIPAGVTIDFLNDTCDCTISGNQTQIHQVFVNLINNAVDAMGGEGNLTISLQRISENDPELGQILPDITSSYCKIDLTDTGHGMDPATIKRIFEPFFTTKEVGKGTGLGLATVHAIIDQHQGKVFVSSQLGQGTTFTLLLPEISSSTIEKENTHGDYSFSGR